MLSGVRELVTFSSDYQENARRGGACSGLTTSGDAYLNTTPAANDNNNDDGGGVGGINKKSLGALGKHKCGFCCYGTDSVTAFRSHVMIHTGERPHVCPFCAYRSTWKHALRRHIKYKHWQQVQNDQEYSK